MSLELREKEDVPVGSWEEIIPEEAAKCVDTKEMCADKKKESVTLCIPERAVEGSYERAVRPKVRSLLQKCNRGPCKEFPVSTQDSSDTKEKASEKPEPVLETRPDIPPRRAVKDITKLFDLPEDIPSSSASAGWCVNEAGRLKRQQWTVARSLSNLADLWYETLLLSQKCESEEESCAGAAAQIPKQ